MKKDIKLILSIFIVILICCIGYEVGYNKVLYNDFIETHNKLILYEERFNRLWEKHLEVVNKGGN